MVKISKSQKQTKDAPYRGVVCESDRFRETSIKVESGVLESDMRSLKMTPWSLKMT